MPSSPFASLPPFDAETQAVNVVVETPKGSRNKFKYDLKTGVFVLGTILPAGFTFPYDFGYVPGTMADDGDPLDVLLLLDVPAFTGCLVKVRLLGVIEAEQTELGKTVRNDRLVAVAEEAHLYRDLRELKDVDIQLRQELDHFFASYNEMRGKRYKTLSHRGPRRAMQLLQQAIKKATEGA